MGEKISNIRFIPFKKLKSHVGFCSFTYEGMDINDVAVHIRADRKGYRLVYPKNRVTERNTIRPINKATQEEIDDAITDYLKAQKYDDK